TFINLPPWLWRRDERGRSRLPSPSRLRVSTLRTPLVGRPAGKAGDRNLVWRRSPSRPWRLRCVDPPPFRLQTAPMLQNLETLAREARSWPFEQARNLLNHVLKKRLSDAERDAAKLLIDAGKADEALATFEALRKPVVLETGYGPSGLPHMGTFGEVAR